MKLVSRPGLLPGSGERTGLASPHGYPSWIKRDKETKDDGTIVIL
jgi:hypothetical protein